MHALLHVLPPSLPYRPACPAPKAMLLPLSCPQPAAFPPAPPPNGPLPHIHSGPGPGPGTPAQVVASYGHVRDLPSKPGAVEPDAGFAMRWAVPPPARQRLDEIEQELRGGGGAGRGRGGMRLVLATDPDREGEAISWHVAEEMKVGWVGAGLCVCHAADCLLHYCLCAAPRQGRMGGEGGACTGGVGVVGHCPREAKGRHRADRAGRSTCTWPPAQGACHREGTSGERGCQVGWQLSVRVRLRAQTQAGYASSASSSRVCNTVVPSHV